MAPPTASEIGSYFVERYYRLLQSRRDLVHRFYTDESTLFRSDGTDKQAVGMQQIKAVLENINFVKIQIKTAHSFDSWNGGILTTISGTLQIHDHAATRNFAQSFFLAPQLHGYSVRNDVFHFLDEEEIEPDPSDMVEPLDFDSKSKASTSSEGEFNSDDQYLQSEQPYPGTDKVEAPTRALEEIRLEEAAAP